MGAHGFVEIPCAQSRFRRRESLLTFLIMFMQLDFPTPIVPRIQIILPILVVVGSPGDIFVYVPRPGDGHAQAGGGEMRARQQRSATAAAVRWKRAAALLHTLRISLC